MKKKFVLGFLVVVLLLTVVLTSYAYTYTKVKQWGNQYVLSGRYSCYTLPYNPGYTIYKVVLHPLTVDVDLHLFGLNGTTWTYLGGSANGGLTNDVKTFLLATRNAYNTIIACGYGWGGNGYFSLTYYVGF